MTGNGRALRELHSFPRREVANWCCRGALIFVVTVVVFFFFFF